MSNVGDRERTSVLFRVSVTASIVIIAQVFMFPLAFFMALNPNGSNVAIIAFLLIPVVGGVLVGASRGDKPIMIGALIGPLFWLLKLIR